MTRYQKWTHKSRNTAPGDVVLILDKETSKGQFCLGVVDSVKLDPDQQVRKVTVKYKTKSSLDRNSNHFKYTERNVRGLALLVKAEERQDFENVNFDMNRLEARIVSDTDENIEKESNDERSEFNVDDSY